VSTVGEYWPERPSREIHAEVRDPAWLDENRSRKGDDFDRAYMQRFGFHEIGCDRTYETMVFADDSYDDLGCWRWESREDALAGHQEIVRGILDGSVDLSS
jgi:hypothetical protein